MISILIWPLLLTTAAFALLWLVSFLRVVHDKSINADALQRLQAAGELLPLGVVVPSHNRWANNAFVAERPSNEHRRQISVLILDDHYRGTDPLLRSPSGVIGDEVSPSLLCSLRQQAKTKGVTVDPAIVDMIASRCANFR
jgi:hypothetical protein